jgi:hypothetical protein
MAPRPLRDCTRICHVKTRVLRSSREKQAVTQARTCRPANRHIVEPVWCTLRRGAQASVCGTGGGVVLLREAR